MMQWVTRERPKIDRIACPWLILRFIDPTAQICFVPPDEVLVVAERDGAIAFDIQGVELTHRGPLCSFDAFLSKYRLDDPALHAMARIVQAADTDTLHESAQAPGLLAISLGMGANIEDDQELLTAGLVVYDALYTWCRDLSGECHGWNPQTEKHKESKS